MSVFTALRDWLSRKKKPPQLTDANLSAAIPRDLGVRVERIRLPSGGEVVIVERIAEDAVAIAEVPKAAAEAGPHGHAVVRGLGVEP